MEPIRLSRTQLRELIAEECAGLDENPDPIGPAGPERAGMHQDPVFRSKRYPKDYPNDLDVETPNDELEELAEGAEDPTTKRVYAAYDNPKTKSVSFGSLSPSDCLDLALVAIDQAGVDLATQHRIIDMLGLELDEDSTMGGANWGAGPRNTIDT